MDIRQGEGPLRPERGRAEPPQVCTGRSFMKICARAISGG